MSGVAIHPAWMPQTLVALVEAENAAVGSDADEWWYEPLLVPALLQAPAYTEAILSVLAPGDEFNDPRLQYRQRRQRNMLASQRRSRFVIGEAALRTVVGGVDVMVAQMHHLLRAGGRPGIEVQMAPFPLGVHRGYGFSFVWLKTSTGQQYLYREAIVDSSFDDDPDLTRQYAEMFEAMCLQALDFRASKQFIAQMAKEWASKAGA